MKVWILLCALLFPALLHAEEQTLAPWTLLDQHDRPYTLADDLQVLLVARDMAGAKLVEAALAGKPEGYLEQRRAVFLADISRMPSLIAKMFAVPAMRDYPYRVILDREARIVWMNERYARRFGLPNAEAAIGKPCESVIPASLMRDVVQTGQPILLDLLDTPKDQLVVMRLPIHDQAGVIIGAIGFALFDELRNLSPLLTRYQSLQKELASTRSLLQTRRAKYSFSHFIGTSPASLAVKRTARRSASTESPVLLLGETGTGKELLAHAIHAASPRAHKPFVSVNSAAIPESLLEAEFFGTAPGAFTGAERKGRLGKLQVAEGGTLFLDEIGDFPLILQPKLLRFIQDKEYERVGDPVTRRADVRILAATNLKLEDMVREGRFREDLLYRLNVITLNLPPLRERPEDVLQLAESFLSQFVTSYGRPARAFSSEASEALASYSWPGNVRELRNVIERASIICPQEYVEVSHLGMSSHSGGNNAPRVGESLSLEQLEKAHIAAVMATSETLDQAAKTLGIDASTLYRKRKQYGL